MADTGSQLAFKRILSTVAEYKASDLHLTIGNPPILRVDTKLIPLEKESVVTPDFIENVADTLLSDEQKKVLDKDKEIVLAYSLEDKARFRVNIFYQKGYPSVSFHYIGNKIKTLKDLGLPPVVEQFTKIKKGLVVVSGPFGSGKTTTLISIINTINSTRSEYILTIENPIEYLFVNNKSIVEQREVGRDTPSLVEGLKTVTQEDVDVVMVSDIPNADVIREVLNIADSGRIVYTSINADSVVKSIEKMVSIFSLDEQKQARSFLADNLEGVVCQRLLPRVGGGRIVVAEILIPTEPVRNVIKEGVFYQINNIIQTSREEGMISLDKSLAELVKTGEIIIEEALAYAQDPQSLRVMARR